MTSEGPGGLMTRPRAPRRPKHDPTRAPGRVPGGPTRQCGTGRNGNRKADKKSVELVWPLEPDAPEHPAKKKKEKDENATNE